MQSIRSLLFFLCAGLTFSAAAQTEKTDTLKVYGACGMCKGRIQKTLKVEGVSGASWSSDSQLLTVSYNPAIISNDEIQRKLAAVGHDTEKYAAPDEVYNKLPGCCLYDRKKVEKKKEDNN